MTTKPSPTLCELSAHELSTGSDLDAVVKRAGYSVSPSVLIGQWNCWDATLVEFTEMLEASNEVTGVR